jgi:hypothetical protein
MSEFYSVPYNLILGSVNGGRLWRSLDEAASWGEFRPDGNNNRTWAGVAIYQGAAAILAFSGTGTESVKRSTDKGITWSTVTSPNANNFNDSSNIQSGAQATKIAIQKNGSLCVMVGETTGNAALPNVFISTDRAATFAELVVNGITAVKAWTQPAISPITGKIILGGNLSNLNALFAQGAYLSTDGGGTWSTVIGNTGATQTIFCNPVWNVDETKCIACAFNSILGSALGFYLSVDGGQTFTLFAQETLRDYFAWGEDDRLFAVRTTLGGSIKTTFYSDDDGLTWTAVNPRQSLTTATFGGIVANGSEVIVWDGGVSGSGRVYRSTDNGLSYSEIQPAGNLNQAWCSFAIEQE